MSLARHSRRSHRARLVQRCRCGLGLVSAYVLLDRENHCQQVGGRDAGVRNPFLGALQVGLAALPVGLINRLEGFQAVKPKCYPAFGFAPSLSDNRVNPDLACDGALG